MSTTNLTHTTGRKLTTPLALFVASAVIWTLASGSSTVGQQANQSTATATQSSASQSAVAKTTEVARDSNAKADPAAVDKSQNKTSRRSNAGPSPLLAAKEHQFHPVQVRELLDRWLADGLVRARDASNGEPAPDLSLTLSDASWGEGERASAALLELSELRIPNVSMTFPISKRTDGKTPQPVAMLSIGPRVEWEAARSIVDVFARHGISTKVDRRPTLSLWFVSSSFSSPDNEELKSVVDELGLKVHKEHPLQLRTEVLFPENAAAIYEPQRAAQLLKWLKVRKLVFEEIPGDEQSPWRVTRSPVGVEQNNGLVKRTSTWSWQASTHISPALQPGIDIQRALTVTEDWRGKAGPGDPAIAYTSFSVPVEPGKVAIVHAFPIFDGQNDPMFAAVPAAHRKENYIAILIIQNHTVEQSARELLTDSDEPKLLVPDAGVPVRLFPGMRSGNAFAADFQVPARLVDVHSRVIELHNLPRTSNPDVASADNAQKFSLQFKSAPWPDVLELLSEKAGFTLDLRSTPPGTLGLEDPSLYSPAEAIDRLNEQLVGKGFILIPRDRTLICLNFEKEPVTRDLVPSVSVDDLPSRGRYELLSVTIPVSDENKKQVAQDLNLLKGPAGTVALLESENAIVVTDLGVNLRQIARTVPAVSIASNKRWLEVYQRKSADPRSVGESLNAILPGAVVKQDVDAKRIHVMGTAKQHEQVRQQIARLDSQDAKKQAEAEAAPAPKLVVVGDGGARSEQDRERLRKLIEAGILVQDDSVPQAFRAQITLQPKVPADKLAAQGMGMLGGPSSSPGDPAPPTLPPINAGWDKAVRSLHSFLHNRASAQWRVDKCDVRLSYDPYVADADARLVIPEASPDEFAEMVMDLFREAGLTVITWRQHPVFSAVPWVKGKETFAVFATEGGSPAQALSGLNEIVDVRFVDDHPAWLRNRTILEKQRVDVVPTFGTSAQKRRIVGLTISAEDARLLRAAERLGRLEAFRRDPKDVEDRVSPEDRDNLRGQLLSNGGGQDSDVRSSAAAPSTPAANSQFKIFKLQNARAGAMSALLAQVVRANGFTAVADERTNSVIVTSPDEDSALLADALLAKLDEQSHNEADPLARRERGGSGQSAKPLADLQTAYAQREQAAAKQARDLRDVIAKRRPGLSDKDFSQEQTHRHDELAKAVKEAFAARQAMLAAELDALKSKIAATEQSLELRNRAAEEIIFRRVEDLLNPELAWDDPGAAASGTPSQLPSSTAPKATAPAGTLSPGDSLSGSRPAQGSGSGGGQFGPFRGQTSATSKPTRPTVSASSSFGVPGEETSSNPFAATARKRRILFIEGLDGIQVRELTEHLGLPDVTISELPGQRVEVSFEAADEDFQKRKVQLDDAAAEVRRETQARHQVQMLEVLTGIWEPIPSGFGAEMGSGAPPVPGGVLAKLVIHEELAASFEGNERKRLWTLRADQEGRYTFTAADGQSGMQGSYDKKNDQLRVVFVGTDGAQIVHYSRTISAVPPEWVAEMQKAMPRTKAKPWYGTEVESQAADPMIGVSRNTELLRGLQNGTVRRSQRTATDSSSRKPSDYLELVRPYAELLAERDKLRRTVGDAHPKTRERAAEFALAERALDLLKKEFETELQTAASQLALKRASLDTAKAELDRMQALKKSNATTQIELQRKELEFKDAETLREAAELRLKLLESTREGLFPKAPSTPPSAPSMPNPVPVTPTDQFLPLSPPAQQPSAPSAKKPAPVKPKPADAAPASATPPAPISPTIPPQQSAIDAAPPAVPAAVPIAPASPQESAPPAAPSAAP